MSYTVSDLQQFIQAENESLRESLLKFKEIPAAMKEPGSLVERMWFSSCWLSQILTYHGCSDELRDKICFAHGQRSTLNDPHLVAVQYANEFIATGKAAELPGESLAETIERERCGNESMAKAGLATRNT